MSVPIASTSLYFLCGGEGGMKEMWAMNSCHRVLQTGKYPRLFLSPAFKDAGLGTAFPAAACWAVLPRVQFREAAAVSSGACLHQRGSQPMTALMKKCGKAELQETQ